MTLNPLHWSRPTWAGFKALLGTARFWMVMFLALLVLLIVYYAASNRYTPFTDSAYVQAFVVQVAPQVAGQVVQVYVQENQRVEKGAVLFEIDPRPFAFRVRQLEAAHAKARADVLQMESALQGARAEEAKIAADEAYALAVFDQESSIFKKDATTERKYLDALQRHKATQAMRDQARALIRSKEQALQARLGNEHAVVATAKAALGAAQLDLEWTKVTAPATGYITDLQLQPGSYVQPGRPVMTCIDAESSWIVGNFRESNLEAIRPGQYASIAFRTYPGRVFTGRVTSVGWGIGQGQGVPSGDLPVIHNPHEWVPSDQRFQVRLALDDPGPVLLRVGASGSATVYTDDTHVLNGVADVWQRLAAWFYYIR